MQEIIDINTMFGPLPAAATDLSVDDLAAMVSKHSVKAGLTLSTVGMLLDANSGNSATTAACKQIANLLPVATYNPLTYFGDNAALAKVNPENFRVVRFFPSVQGWDVSSANFIAVVDALGAQMPIMVDIEQPGIATRMLTAAGHHAGPIILSCVDELSISEAVALMRKYPSLYVETSNLLATGAIKHAVTCVGAERFLYGSGAPSRPMAGAIGVMKHSGLSNEQLNLIMGANAKALFKI